jgi:hypothetical protein
MASGLLFIFCALGLVFGSIVGVGSRFQVLRSRLPFSMVPKVLCPVFTFCALGLVFGGTGGVGSRFHVLRAQTCFRRYRGRRVPFSRFALPDLFSGVPRASSPVFMFCAPELVFGSTEGVRSRFQALLARTLFGGIDGVGSRFHVLLPRTRFRRYRVRRVLLSCFARPDSFLAVPRASGPVFTFYTPGLVFGDTEDVVSRFHVLLARTRFQLY